MIFEVFLKCVHFSVLCRSTHKLVYYINLDKIFDDLRPNLVDFILQNGFDPLEIRDMSGSILPFMVRAILFNDLINNKVYFRRKYFVKFHNCSCLYKLEFISALYTSTINKN